MGTAVTEIQTDQIFYNISEIMKKNSTKQERELLVEKIRSTLEKNNFGFKPLSSEYLSCNDEDFCLEKKVVTFENVKKLPAIKELYIRLLVFTVKGENDKGFIYFPECKRRIDYNLDANDLNKCEIKMKALSKTHCYIYDI